MSPLIVLRDVQKEYSGVTAVKVTKAVFYENEKVVIFGGNGSGKSTLLKVCAGLTPATRGLVDTQNISGLRRGYLPQYGGIYEDMTINENLKMFLDAFGACENADTQGIAQEFELTDKLDRHIRTLSGGYKKLASIFCHLSSSAQIQFLDEPLSSLDAEKQSAVTRALSNYTVETRLLVVAEHSKNAFLFEEQKKFRLENIDDMSC